MGMTPYKMVYGKACHLPLELEHRAFWAIKNLNYDFKAVGEKRLLDINALDEFRREAYDNARLLKEIAKRWYDSKIENKVFKSGDKVLLYNSCLKLFPGKLRSKWKGPYIVEEAYPSGAVKLKGKTPTLSWVVNGQRLKHYRAKEGVSAVTTLVVTPEEVIKEEYNHKEGKTRYTFL